MSRSKTTAPKSAKAAPRASAKLLPGLAIALACLARPGLAGDDAWLKEEVLRQLSEIRQDNLALRKELEALKRQVAGQGGGAGGSGQEAESSKKLADLLGGGAPLGAKGAGLVMVEFTDYQCPYCRTFDAATFPKLKKAYIDTGKLRYAVRDFPLPFHGQAAAAAVAARCAGEQGGYWAMKPRLFQHQDGLGRELFARQAAELRLDAAKFARCLDAPEARKAVEGDLAYGNSLGIRGTPTFLIGRIDGAQVKDIKAVSGALSFASLAQLLDALREAR